MLKLSIRTGPQAGMEFPTDRPSLRLGRGSGNDIVLQDTQASRNHAEITQQGDQFFVRDLGSMNGTFVNEERITGPRLLQPGDQIRIGETIMACQAGVMAVPTMGEDWESDLWQEEVDAGAGRQRTLIWVLAGILGVLLIAAVVAAILLLGRDGKEQEADTPVAVVPTEAPTSAIQVAPTATTEPEPTVEPTSDQLVDVPTLEPVPTVKLDATVPPVQPPPAPVPPAPVPASPDDLEKLPSVVTEYLGDIPPEQLPDEIAAQIESLGPEQVQEMIGALFPGVAQTDLLGVVSASFPGLSDQDIQGLLGMVFPGQNIQIPEVGPLGGRLALGIYDSSRDQYDLYLAPVVGGNPTLLKENASEPTFSPDGQYIAYHSQAPDTAGLRIMKIDGSDEKALTTVGSDRNPRFSPDGMQILFSNVDNNTLHIINRDGTGRRDIGQGKFPDWSPDGQEIVYQGCVSGGRCGLIRANANGSNPRQITTHANDRMPRWRYGNVAFLSDRDGNWEIYVISDNGTWLRRITLVPATDIMPCWNPSGVQLAFRSDRGGDPAVYITSGIGGGDFKQFSAAFGSDWMLASMDWAK